MLIRDIDVGRCHDIVRRALWASESRLLLLGKTGEIGEIGEIGKTGETLNTPAKIRFKRYFRGLQRGLGCFPRCLQWIVFEYSWTCVCLEKMCVCECELISDPLPERAPEGECTAEADDILVNIGCLGFISIDTQLFKRREAMILHLLEHRVKSHVKDRAKSTRKTTKLRSYRQLGRKVPRIYTRKRDWGCRSHGSLELKLLRLATRARQRAEWKRQRVNF